MNSTYAADGELAKQSSKLLKSRIIYSLFKAHNKFPWSAFALYLLSPLLTISPT